MALAASQIQVPDQQAMDSAITSYIAQGFTVQNRGEDFAVMFKKKEFNVLWAVIGLVLCLLPLLIYLLVYAMEKDQLVEIRVGAGGGAAAATAIHWSDDGEHWWDGSEWRSVRAGLPPDSATSPDGEHFYDGTKWRAMPAELRSGGGDSGSTENVQQIESGHEPRESA